MKTLTFSMGVTRMDRIRKKNRGTFHVGCFGDEGRKQIDIWIHSKKGQGSC